MLRTKEKSSKKRVSLWRKRICPRCGFLNYINRLAIEAYCGCGELLFPENPLKKYLHRMPQVKSYNEKLSTVRQQKRQALKRTTIKKVAKKVIRKRLVKELDKIVSQIVIKRDEKCVTCGSKEQLTCGHIFSRSHYSTRWNLKNCHAQCWPCNYKYKMQDTIFYYNWYVNTFGLDEAKALYEEWKTIRKFTDLQLQELIIELNKHG